MSDKSAPNPREDDVVGCLFAFASLPLVVALESFVVGYGWNHFAVRFADAPPLPYFAVMGLLALVGALRRVPDTSKDTRTWSVLVSTAVLVRLSALAVMVFANWMVSP